MSAAHVCFADMPSVGREGHSALDSFNDDATIRQCSARDRHCTSPHSSDSPIPRYERNMGFFRQLSRRFGLRSNDDLVFTGSNDEDNQSSSTDSYTSQTTTAAAAAAGKEKENQLHSSLAAAAGPEYISCASSETSSTIDIDEQQQNLQQQQQNVNDEYENNISDKDTNDEKADAGVAVNDGDDVKQTYNKDRKSLTRSSFSRLQRRSTSSIRRAFEAFSLSSRSLSCSGATPPPPPNMATTSSVSLSTNNGTPIKSALKSSSNLELNKKSSQSSSATACASTTNRSHSLACSSSSSLCKSSSKTKTKPPPQRILRQPVSYTYLKGISGLPTQRVPRSSVCCQYARR